MDDEELRRTAEQFGRQVEDMQTTMGLFAVQLGRDRDPVAIAVAFDNAREVGLTPLRLVDALVTIAYFGYRAAAEAKGTTPEQEIQAQAAAIALMVQKYREWQAGQDDG